MLWLYFHLSCLTSCPYIHPIALYGSPSQSGGFLRVLWASPPTSSAYLSVSSSRSDMRKPFGSPVFLGNPCGNAYLISPYPGRSSLLLNLLTCGVKSFCPIILANAISLPTHIMCWSVSQTSPSK